MLAIFHTGGVGPEKGTEWLEGAGGSGLVEDLQEGAADLSPRFDDDFGGVNAPQGVYRPCANARADRHSVLDDHED